MNGRPEPLLSAATVASVVTVVTSILVTFGVISAEDGDRLSNSAGTLIAAVIGVVAVVAHIVAAFHARGKVTPLTDPRDSSGNQLQ